MSLITISGDSFCGAEELGAGLARRTGYGFLTREELSEHAAHCSVPVETLRNALSRPPRFFEDILIERDQYLSCLTVHMCERVLEENLVYLGHLGHMLLPGAPNILRVRLTADMDYRINDVSERLAYSHREAREHIDWIDISRDKWVRFLYGVDWHDPLHYDLVINLSRTSPEAAADALASLAARDEYQMPRHGRAMIEDIRLASRARFGLLDNEKTRHPDIRVTSRDGSVQVIYRPRFADAAEYVSEVLSGIEGIVEVHTAIAQHRLLYVEENYDPGSTGFRDVLRAARNLDAAVELIALHLDEPLPESPPADAGFEACRLTLREQQRLEGSAAVYGDRQAFLHMVQRRTKYRLIIVGDLFADKQDDLRRRLKEDLQNSLTERLNIPVVGIEELHRHIGPDRRRTATILGYLAVAAVLIALTAVFQQELTSFMVEDRGLLNRLAVVTFVMIVTPVFAFCYGSFMRQILKFFGLD